MSTGSVVVRLNLNSAGYSAEMAKAERQMRALAASTTAMGHGTVTTMQASSAAIRLAEGGITNSIRAAERFISTLPGVGAALQAAFPVVGAAALAAVFVRVGEEAVNFVQKLNAIPENPFTGMIASANVANDALSITNDRLQMEIDKLEHKPVNGMALALDEAKQASDKLSESLDRSNKAFTEAMGKMNVSKLQGLWRNATPTEQADQNITKARAGVQQVRDDHQSTIDDANASGNLENIRQANEARMVDLQKAYAQEDAALRAGLAAARRAQANYKGSYSVGSDPSTVIQKYTAALQQSAVDQANAGGQYGESILKPKKDDLDAANANQEAEKERQDAIVNQWREALRQDKANATLSTDQEAAYWLYRAETAKKGSLSYIAALDEANKDIAKINAESMLGQKTLQSKNAEFDASTAASYRPDAMDLSRGDSGAEKEQGQSSVAYIHSLNEQVAAQRQAADAVAEQSLEMAVAAGQMSKLDAAQVRATMHTQEFEQAWQRLQTALANASQVPGEAGRTMVAGLNAQAAQMAGQRTMQSAQDQQAIASQQIVPAMTQALGRMANDWKNMANQIVQVMTRAADSLNDSIARAATGQKGGFGKAFQGIGQSLVKTGLQGAEGYGLKMLGLGGSGGKRDGSSEMAALFVQIARGNAIAASSGALDLSSPGRTATVGLQDLVPGGSFIQPFISALPHLAGGGDFMANHPMVVGEAGPEILNPGFSGSVTPNSALGGDTNHYYQIDARGATDPAAVHAAVARALPHAVAASVQAVHAAATRKPQGR